MVIKSRGLEGYLDGFITNLSLHQNLPIITMFKSPLSPSTILLSTLPVTLPIQPKSPWDLTNPTAKEWKSQNI